MTTPQQAEEYRLSQARLTRLIRRDVDRFVLNLRRSPMPRALELLVEFLSALTDEYGPISATLAADYYESLRAVSVGTNFTARPTLPDLAERIDGTARWLVGEMIDPADVGKPAATLKVVDAKPSALAGAAQKYVQEYGRRTIIDNVGRDETRPLWARVPAGETCAFCLMLASRGAVYTSERDAGGLGHVFHDECDCQPTVTWGGGWADLPYDPEPLYQAYLAAGGSGAERDPSKWGSGLPVEQILANLRRNEGIN